MNVGEKIIAQRYARAFLTVFGNQISYDDFIKTCSLGGYLAGNRTLTFYLTIPTLSAKIKKEGLFKIIHQYKLGAPFEKLVILLIKDKRSFLLGAVLFEVCRLYEKFNRIMTFDITSSHKLDQEVVDVLVQFLQHKTDSTIVHSTHVDPSLIAGIRMQSETLLWEHSIKQQLRNVRLHH